MDVLVVDDAPDIRLLLRFALGSRGFHVTEAGSGAEALATLATGRLPDVVVLDIQMPVMDGLETLRAIRRGKRTSGLAVVLCSVKARDVDQEEGWRAGCDGYVTKPFDIDDLIRAVSQAVERRPPRNGDRQADVST